MRGMRTFLLSSLVLALAACGFHPRQNLALPEDLGPVRVTSRNAYSPLVNGLSRALERSGAQIADESDTAPESGGAAAESGDIAPESGSTAPASGGTASLRILSEQMTFGPLSLDNVSRVREYVTTFTVSFQFDDSQGQALVPRQQVALSRDFAYDSSQPIGTPAEQEVIEEELRRDMVAAILRRIDAAMRARQESSARSAD